MYIFNLTFIKAITALEAVQQQFLLASLIMEKAIITVTMEMVMVNTIIRER